MSERKQSKAEPPAEERAKAQKGTTIDRPGGGLDFSKLDLSVETVDERISPSETNVFDK
ncbi:MAG: hypothetical protein H6831_03755 [Planctomycetes bacterium]|nr:hypothetical protein [Planctomycetota bacterium]MCB9903501.1 hypothetical protein [Planctomycetota bacterium]